MTTIRVLLADDHALIRAGVRALLANLEGIEVVAEAADGNEALDRIAVHQPDVALIDIAMPGLGGLEVAERVARDHPRTRVIILSMHLDEEYIRQALHVGASGYLVKDAATSELEPAIRAVARDETYLSPAVSTQVLAGYLRSSGRGTESVEPLTSRQREVLRLIAEGLTTKAIARRLGIAVKTAETHRTQLMGRLGIHDIAGLVRYAIRMGVLKLGE